MNSTKSNRTKPAHKNSTTRKKRIFKKKDFISGDGMLTSVWGPSMWHYLHTMSFNYPVNPTEDDKKNYMNFGRLITLDDVHKTIKFLVVENTGITGQSITVDLGFTNFRKYN